MSAKAATILWLCSFALTGCHSAAAPAPAADASTGETADAPPEAAAEAAAEAPPSGPAVPARLFELIDDLDHESGREGGFICPVGLCSWFSRPVDAAGVSANAALVAPVPARGASRKAWHLRTGPETTGVDVRLDIHGPGHPVVAYPDLSVYAGIAFWARGDADDQDLLVAIEDDKVIAPSYAEAAAGSKPWFTRALKVGTEWRRYIVLFDDFHQVDARGTRLGTGQLNTTAIWSVHFIAGLDRRAGGVWVDDLALLCKGDCPVPPHDLRTSTTASGLRDEDLSWTTSSSQTPELRCAEVAALSTIPADRWVAGPGLRVFLRARVAENPRAGVPLWGWTIEKLPEGTTLPVTPLDEGHALIAVPVSEAGQYRVRTHTHYPGLATCGVEITATATIP